MESIETVKTETDKSKRKNLVNPDRIVLEKDSISFLANIAEQIESSFGGIIKLTHKELANFILQNRCQSLDQGELKLIKDKYFDDVRAAQWALQKLKTAKDEGRELSLSDVLGMIQTPLVTEKRPRKITQERKKKSPGGPSTDLEMTNQEPLEVAKGP